MQRAVVVIACLGVLCSGAAAEAFRIEDVRSIAGLTAGRLKPHTIYFADQRKDELADPVTGLVRFEDWARARPSQKQFLALFPSYDEPAGEGGAKRKLHVYVAQARFLIAKQPASIDLARYATIEFLERLDPAVKHRRISPADALTRSDPNYADARHPDRQWCEGVGIAICTQSRYKFEGQLPSGILLANKLREQGKQPIPDYIEFQSEIRLLSSQQPELSGVAQLTEFDGQVGGALEQSIFWVNHVIQFGKLLAVMQQNPADPGTTVATVYVALAIKTEVLNRQKQYENVPILRNLVPAQVLMGNSSFNSGNSISAGLPKYARNRIMAIAELIERE